MQKVIDGLKYDTNITLFTVVFFLLATSYAFAGDQAALKNRLAYLKDIPEVSEVKYVDNQVYIGFNRCPSDIGAIVGGAAAFGSSAYGSRITVWGCEYDKHEPNPEKWGVYGRGKCYAIARGGETRKNRCPGGQDYEY